MKIIINLCLLIIFTIPADNLIFAQNLALANKDWDEFLSKNVSESGKVNYSEIIRHT